MWSLAQGNCILRWEDFEQIGIVPAGLFPFGLDTDFGRALLLEQV